MVTMVDIATNIAVVAMVTMVAIATNIAVVTAMVTI